VVSPSELEFIGQSVPPKFSPPPAWHSIFTRQTHGQPQRFTTRASKWDLLEAVIHEGRLLFRLPRGDVCAGGLQARNRAHSRTLDASRSVRSSLTIPSCYSMSRIFPGHPHPHSLDTHSDGQSALRIMLLGLRFVASSVPGTPQRNIQHISIMINEGSMSSAT
jgi:hypothetical protein